MRFSQFEKVKKSEMMRNDFWNHINQTEKLCKYMQKIFLDLEKPVNMGISCIQINLKIKLKLPSFTVFLKINSDRAVHLYQKLHSKIKMMHNHKWHGFHSKLTRANLCYDYFDMIA